MSKPKKKKIYLNENSLEPVDIVNVSMISSVGVADGKMLPVIFLDTTDRPDIDNFLENYEKLSPIEGDVSSVFGKKNHLDNSSIQMILQFTKPIRCDIIINFLLEKYAPALDSIVRNQGCYIQSAKNGKRMSTTMGEPRIILEILTGDFKDKWEDIYFKATVNKFKKKGVSRMKAKEMANQFIDEIRKMEIRF